MEETVNNTTDGDSKGPLTAIGLFLSVFGAAVLFGIIFTETSHGKITNAICGGIIFLIGIGVDRERSTGCRPPVLPQEVPFAALGKAQHLCSNRCGNGE